MWDMKIEHWFLRAQLVRGQLALQQTPQQTTPLAPCPCKKRQRAFNEPFTGSSIPLTEHSLASIFVVALTLLAKDISLKTRPTNQPIVIGSKMAFTSTSSSSGWHNTFMLGDQPLPDDSYVWIWRNGLGGQVVDNLGQALLLLGTCNTT